MIEVTVVSGLACAVAIAAYLERKSLKADVASAEAKVLTVAEKLIAELQLKEKSVRAKVSADVAKVIANAKVEAQKLAAVPFLECAQATIEKIEADLKKIL